MRVLNNPNGAVPDQKVPGERLDNYNARKSRNGDVRSKSLTSRSNVILAFFLSVAILLYHIFKPDDSWRTPNKYIAGDGNKPANFHVLIPASHQDVNLCKVLLSAAILGYPTPVIINWEHNFEDPSLVEGGSHLGKITGVLEYLQSLPTRNDDDLVLMIDSYDLWLQLRPQTLLDRYFDINKRADERIKSEIGPKAVEKNGIRQQIVFGCQKRCWPWTFDDPPCYAVPNSSLPSDIFGPRTDTPSDNEETPYINNRPRFLVSGTALGTVRAFRKLFYQAKTQLEYESNFGSDQYIFSHIFGDQEIWREALRRDALRSWNNRGGLHSDFNEDHIEEVRNKARLRDDRTFEFGIGIDYGSEIVLNTVFAEDDTGWLRFDDKNELLKAQEEHNVPLRHKTTDLSVDVKTSLPPFWTFSQENVSRWTSWEEVPIFTNIYTGIQPAIIHHNAHRNGLKSLREAWWPLIWFQKHARTLLDAHIYAPAIPVAHAGLDDSSKQDYWSYEIWKGGARNGPAKLEEPGEGWIRFDEICRTSHEELFRDGLGEWELPQAH